MTPRGFHYSAGPADCAQARRYAAPNGLRGIALAAPAQSNKLPVAVVAGCRVLSVCLGVFAVLAVVLRVPLSSGSVLSRSWSFSSRSAAARFLVRCRAALAWWRRRGRSVGSSVVPSSRVPVGCLRWWFAPRWLVGGRVWLSVACSGGRCPGRRFWCRALSVWPGGRRLVR